MSGFENTARRPPGETPTGPFRIPSPPDTGVAPPSSPAPEALRQRRRSRSASTRTIAVAGIGGGIGTTTVSAALLVVLGERLGVPLAVGDHAGGVLRSRTARIDQAPSSGPLLSDLGPHAQTDAGILSRIGDVVVVVAPLQPEGVRRGEAARRAVVDHRDGDEGAAVLVVAESRPTRSGTRRRAVATARESGRTIVLRWDPALADRRPVDSGAFTDATRTALSELCDAIRV